METTFVRDAAVIGFSANELLSIVENAGLMGIPMPKVITDAVEVLQNRSEEEH
jgi:phage-related holin